MRIVVSGGGTGGHIYPALAIADKFKKAENAEILYVGFAGGVGMDIVEKAGYRYALIDSCPIEKKTPKALFNAAVRIFKGIVESLKILKDFKPDFVCGTGGFVCYPLIFAAYLRRIPAFLQEQNAFPGRTNQHLENKVKKVFLGFEPAKEYFKHQEKMIFSGNPVREVFYTMTKDEARKNLGFKEDEKIVLSFGGSLGAPTINDLAFRLLKEINGRDGVRLIFGTGKWYYDEIIAKIKDEGIELKDNIVIKSYIDDMPNYLVASDFVIARSGALSLAEIASCGKASLLIPSPHVYKNHQFFNANAVAVKGGAMLVEEKNLDIEAEAKNVLEILNDEEKLTEIGRCAKLCSSEDALDIIYSNIKKIIGK